MPRSCSVVYVACLAAAVVNGGPSKAADAEHPQLMLVAEAGRAGVPTVVVVTLDRPAILTPLQDKVTALVGEFGASDDAVLDVLTGNARPEGRLPFELPSSMAAVEAQQPDAPHDSEKPLYPIFFGLRYR